MKLTDAQILQFNFSVAEEKATPEEKERIHLYQSALKESPTSPEIIDMCAEFYAEIHHLLIGSRVVWRTERRKK